MERPRLEAFLAGRRKMPHFNHFPERTPACDWLEGIKVEGLAVIFVINGINIAGGYFTLRERFVLGLDILFGEAKSHPLISPHSVGTSSLITVRVAARQGKVVWKFASITNT